ncbi:MAG TPA: helix-turn-helix transcriptional regulator, partial [Phenylobacterium sp.]
MTEAFGKKLELALKRLSMSRSRLAADLGVDKSVVGRWVTGAVQPSAHNLSRLSALLAERIPGFTALDWDRNLGNFGELLGADPEVLSGGSAGAGLKALPLPLLDRFVATSVLRGPAYEGFYRSTRPYVLAPGHFVHDHCMLRLEANGLLSTRIGTAGTLVEGWVLLQGNQMFTIAVDVVSGAVLFGLFNGVGAPKAEVVDGIALTPA